MFCLEPGYRNYSAAPCLIRLLRGSGEGLLSDYTSVTLVLHPLGYTKMYSHFYKKLLTIENQPYILIQMSGMVCQSRRQRTGVAGKRVGF
jgi:hypothetical protein